MHVPAIDSIKLIKVRRKMLILVFSKLESDPRFANLKSWPLRQVLINGIGVKT